MTDRLSAKPLYILAVLGMAGTIVSQSLLLGETKLGSLSKPAASEPASFHDVVKSVLPAVVTIEATQKVSMAHAHLGQPPKRLLEKQDP